MAPFFGIAFRIAQQSNDALAVQFCINWQFCTAEFNQRWKQVNVSRQRVDVDAASEITWPVNEAGDTVSSIVRTALLTSHIAVEDLVSTSSSIVRCENEDRIVGNALVLNQLSQFTDVGINVRNHAQKIGHAFTLVLVRFAPFFRTMQRAVRGIG